MAKKNSNPLSLYALFGILFLYLAVTYSANNWAFVKPALQGLANIPHMLLLVVLVGGLYVVKHVDSKMKSLPLWIVILMGMCLSCTGSIILASAIHGQFDGSALLTVSWKFIRLLGVLGLVVLSAHQLGSRLTSGQEWLHASERSLINIAIGFLMLTVCAFVLGAFGLLQVYWLWAVVLLPIAVFYGSSLNTLKQVFRYKLDFNRVGRLGPLMMGLLIFFAGLNMTACLLPFPLGWDALALYVNMASLIDGYGALLHGNQAYNWSLLMGVAQILGQSPELSLGMSWVGGILSIFVIYVLAKKWLSTEGALASAALFYTLPTVTFQSTKDFKIDLGLLFISLAILLLLHSSLRTKSFIRKSSDNLSGHFHSVWTHGKPIVLAGLLCGFAFGIKYTAVFIGFSFLATIWWRIGQWKALLTFFAFTIFAVLQLKLDLLSGLRIYHLGVGILKFTMLGVTLAGLIWMYVKQRNQTVKILVTSVAFGLSVLLAFSPWMVKNAFETQSLSIRPLLFGEKSQPEQIMSALVRSQKVQDGVRVNQFTKLTPQAVGGSAKIEEIQRFIGYEYGPMKYLSVPFDISVGNNVSERITNVGFLFFLFLPLLLVMYVKARMRWWVIAGLALYIGLSTWASMVGGDAEGQMTQYLGTYLGPDWLGQLANAFQIPFLGLTWPLKSLVAMDLTAYYYLTYPLLIGLAMLSYWAMFQLCAKQKPSSRGLWLFVLYFYFLWNLLSGGIVWYGYLLLALGAIFMVVFIEKMAGKLQKMSWMALGLWMLVLVGDRLYVTDADADPNQQLLLKQYVAYQTGALESNELLNHIHPQYAEVRDVLNAETNGMIYRVGTFIKYFVDENDRRVFSDNQLDFFDRLHKRIPNQVDLAAQLYDSGFRYIVVDLNTHTIDSTKDKSLTNKFIDFMRWLNDNPRLELVLTDRVVQNPYDTSPNPQQYNLVVGKIIKAGTIAVYKIVDG